MILGNQGLVTQIYVKSSGGTVVSLLSTSISWASTGGLKITSTGFPITGGSTSIDIATGGTLISTGGFKITSTGFPTSTSIDIASGNIGVIASITSGNIDVLDAAMAKRLLWSGTANCYTGWAVIGTTGSAANWRIRQRVFSGDNYTDTWADGDSAFNNVWNNATSLTYS